MENKVLGAIYKSKAYFSKVKGMVNGSLSSPFNDINEILYNKAVEYYDNDSTAESIDIEIIKSYIERKYPRHKEVIFTVLDRISSEEVSSENAIAEFMEVKLTDAAHRLANTILVGGDPSEEIGEYLSLKEGVVSPKEDSLLEAPSYADIAEAMSPDNVIELYPKELQDRVKQLQRGHHMLIYARVETGKTLFTLNLVRGFLDQGLKVLYVGNEDSPAAMLPRIFCSLMGITREELVELSEEEVNEGIIAAGIDNFRFIHLEPGTFKEIRCLTKQLEPDVLIVDQIRNVLTGGDGLTVSLEKAGTEMRNIGNEYNLLAVSITQAGESASGKLVLNLSDIDSSKTGLPATTDLMIGLGVTPEYEGKGKRMVSLPKNKVSGDHSYFSINVDELRSRVVEYNE